MSGGHRVATKTITSVFLALKLKGSASIQALTSAKQKEDEEWGNTNRSTLVDSTENVL